MPSPAEELQTILDDVLPKHRATFGDSTEWEALLAFQRAIAAHGWTAPAWPKEIGGRGLDVVDQIECEAVFNRNNCPTRISVFGVNNVGPTIAVAGTPDQKRHLHGIVTADEIWCQGFSEPNAGSDLAGLQCRADADGDGFVVNGQKVWTSVGLDATHCMLLVRTDPDAPKHRGISALLVPMDLPGIERRAIRQMNGAAEFAEVFYDDVHVPKSALLGPLNEGWRVTMTTLTFERAGVLALAGKLVDEVHELTSDPRLRDADATMRQRAVTAYSKARVLSWLGERSLQEPSERPDAKAMAAGASSLIKLSWSKLIQEAAQLRADLSGLDTIAGIDQAAMLSLLQSPSATIAGGTSEVLKSLIGERALALPKEPSK